MAEDTKTKEAPAVPTVTFTMDGESYTVPKGTTILQVARDNGIHIPTFCWHPKLKVAGACRMCYVEIEKWPKLAISCATEAGDGMVVHTDSELVKQGRAAVIEFILMNHPLDCPTCDKGGECELQNLTFAHGIDDSRFEFRKYRFVDEGMSSTFDDLKIGPEIVLNRNRCILCYKCVRANKEAFGEYDLGCYERGNISQINSAPGQEVDNPFSGNLVEICPVGALTNSDWRYKVRVWLTKSTPSICNLTSSGVNTLFYKEEHKNLIRRATARPNDDIDDGWIPDVSRYGYQLVHSEDRLQTPLIKKDGKHQPATWDEAVKLIAKRFSEIKEKKGGVCIGGLASPSLDNLSLYKFSKFYRLALGSNNVDFRTDYRMLPKDLGSPFSLLCDQPFKIADIDDSDVIVTLGSDLLREHPNEYLRIRKARNFGAPKIYSLNPYAVKTADVADLEVVYGVGKEEALLTGIALAAIEQNVVDSAKAAEYKKVAPFGSSADAAKSAGVDPEDLKIIAKSLAEGGKITLFAGEIIARSKGRDCIAAGILNLNLLLGLSLKGQVGALARYANSSGAMAVGALPTMTESVKASLTETWGSYPDSEGHTTDAMLALMRKEEIDACMILGSDLAGLYPDREFVHDGLGKLDFLVAADLFETSTTLMADVVLPLASWTEFEGDYTNLEGRVQTAKQAIKPLGQAKPAHEIIAAVVEAMGIDEFGDQDKIKEEMNALFEARQSSPMPAEFIESSIEEEVIEEEYPHPLLVCDDPHHCGHLTEKSPSLCGFAGEAYAEISPELADKYNLVEGESVRIQSPVGKLIVAVKISDYLENDVILVPRNFSAAPVTSLLMRKKRVDRVGLSKVEG